MSEEESTLNLQALNEVRHGRGAWALSGAGIITGLAAFRGRRRGCAGRAAWGRAPARWLGTTHSPHMHRDTSPQPTPQAYPGAPWSLTFSYGRALQATALKTWAGNPQDVAKVSTTTVGGQRDLRSLSAAAHLM